MRDPCRALQTSPRSAARSSAFDAFFTSGLCRRTKWRETEAKQKGKEEKRTGMTREAKDTLQVPSSNQAEHWGTTDASDSCGFSRVRTGNVLWLTETRWLGQRPRRRKLGKVAFLDREILENMANSSACTIYARCFSDTPSANNAQKHLCRLR
ncbi:hypothetical protein TGVEG_211080 [Toxoplasma gondii VEG]|uniref:Uncharacterized protein n=2 Tax=Toxoplasma gondii TaxID=5811 RepID=B9QHW3_TOXGV|nr:hypothetical protein TGVEG_211080 [Toxoplasma gondii VEG]KFG43223.1 hypothetical protein TGP89_211080 [Toxoplasma gondii p89]CEL72620.1 TPA: hypothetical protein BN1205_008940 [Toxoplasma gondii VEG]